ncbi:uncharacterized protein [Rutidosis leptorrhynchoides]|uniref:uncharacterized protein n=1 Tax=Rutidosis leptorrhynchoides TaxID=125765 RepID=UPI003A98FB8B
MIQTSNPQFVLSTNPLSLGSNAISIVNLLLLGEMFFHNIGSSSFGSDYKGSTVAIHEIQLYGISMGHIAPMFRFLNHELLIKSSWNIILDFKVEKYWTQKLHEWKEHQIVILSGCRRSKKIVRYLKNVILLICIEFQKLIVVSCKIIRLILHVTDIFFGYCLGPLIPLMAPISSSSDDMRSEGLHSYVLQLEDETRLTKEPLRVISHSMNRLIRNAEKVQQHNLLKLLENPNGFRGIENFDTDQVQPLLSVQLPNNWSLPIVTLTCIAISLPNIHKDISDNLLKSICEGLYYPHLVEESLNSASEYANIHKAAINLSQEVKDNGKWLANSLKRSAYHGKTPVEILKWFSDKAKDIVMDITRDTDDTEQVDNFPIKLIAANSMYRITETIFLKHKRNIEPLKEEELCVLLYGMIADILVACLSNIP